MDDKAIRLAMLRKLIDERFEGVAARLATALDMKPPQLHRWLSGRQGISAESARAIEGRLDLGRGWLDRLADATAPDEAPAATLKHSEPSEDSADMFLARTSKATRNQDVNRALFDLARELERGDLSPEARHLLTTELEAKARFVREALDRLQKKDA